MVGNLPPLDGTEINWDDYSFGRIQSVVLWIVITALFCAMLKIFHMDKFCKAANVVGICMTLMLLVTMISVCITTKGYVNKIDAAVTTRDEFVMSEDTNFVILLLDSIDSETLYDMLESHPEYSETFEDFTYYPNTMGVYPYTLHSIPFIFSGVWYENEIPFQEYNVNAYKDSPFFELLEDKGYELDVYEDEMPLLDRSILRFSNVINKQYKINSFIDFAKWEVELVGIRYAPYDLKKRCIFNRNSFLELRDIDDDYTPFDSSNPSFYEALQEKDITYSSTKRFKFFHLEGAHIPFQYDKDVNFTEGGTYESSVEASMTITQAYLDKLKAAGVYDNSVIIVMADHGYSVTDPLGFDRQNPILFIKGLGEHHEMDISNIPISYEDLQETYVRLLNGGSGGNIVDYREDSQRERRFLYYDFEDYMEEYIQTGHAFDDDTMEATGNVYVRDRG
ncbi:MAG: sulfatase-like hydrolase/transferase [Acetatifactor sp.]|nr:sulfatase-like hydrolase/transferase [Acetatifactor sp.]